MLEHADGHKRIVLAADVPVVVLNIFHQVVQPLLAGLFPGIGQLFPRDVVGMHLDPVVAGHVAGQPAPATTGLDHGHAGLEPELATDMLQFGQLCLFEGQIRALVIGAGVLHFGAVEPELVKLVAQVVMVVNVFLGLGDTG